MITESYRTIESEATGIYKEKGSKFLAFAHPIDSPEVAKIIIDKSKEKYYDARHHCWAYRIGETGEQWRAVDDGEPSGTAGRPIHGQLLSADVTNVLVVVVRYFGGTKLGVSGLINAYGEATRDALSNATIIEKIIEECFTLNFSYLQMNDIMRLIKESQARILEQNFDNLCTMTIAIPRSQAKLFSQKLSPYQNSH